MSLVRQCAKFFILISHLIFLTVLSNESKYCSYLLYDEAKAWRGCVVCSGTLASKWQRGESYSYFEQQDNKQSLSHFFQHDMVIR